MYRFSYFEFNPIFNFDNPTYDVFHYIFSSQFNPLKKLNNKQLETINKTTCFNNKVEDLFDPIYDQIILMFNETKEVDSTSNYRGMLDEYTHYAYQPNTFKQIVITLNIFIYPNEFESIVTTKMFDRMNGRQPYLYDYKRY